jgi:hypothetical protein
MSMNGTWEHSEAGLYRRHDGKGIVKQVGSHDWATHADVGQGLRSCGIGATAAEARDLVDGAIARGTIPAIGEASPGTFLEQVTAKLQRTGLALSPRAGQIRHAEAEPWDCEDGEEQPQDTDAVLLGTGDAFDVAIVVNHWGHKPGQLSYQVFVKDSSWRRISNHDDQRWRYPQKGEEALNEAIATAIEALVDQRLR